MVDKEILRWDKAEASDPDEIPLPPNNQALNMTTLYNWDSKYVWFQYLYLQVREILDKDIDALKELHEIIIDDWPIIK